MENRYRKVRRLNYQRRSHAVGDGVKRHLFIRHASSLGGAPVRLTVALDSKDNLGDFYETSFAYILRHDY